MQLRDLEYFAELAVHGQVARAAAALGLSQPALSLSLRRLEQSAGTRLVKRTPKGVELTAVGSALLTHVHRLRLAREDLEREALDLVEGRAGRLHVGTGPALAERFLPQACAVLINDTAKVIVGVTIGPTYDKLLPGLRSGELDVVVNHVASVSAQGLRFEYLWEDEFVVYASANHRLARRKSVALSDLTQERWASTPGSSFQGWQLLRQTFQERGLPDPQFTLVGDSPMVAHTVALTNLLGIGTRQGAEAKAKDRSLKILPLRNVKWMRTVAVVHRTDGYLSPAARRFIELVKTQAKRIQHGNHDLRKASR